jgi:hypothetical protein
MMGRAALLVIAARCTFSKASFMTHCPSRLDGISVSSRAGNKRSCARMRALELPTVM